MYAKTKHRTETLILDRAVGKIALQEKRENATI